MKFLKKMFALASGVIAGLFLLFSILAVLASSSKEGGFSIFSFIPYIIITCVLALPCIIYHAKENVSISKHESNKHLQRFSNNFLTYEQQQQLLAKIDSPTTSGVYFEKVVCELLKANGFTNVNTTKASGDNGVDVLAEKAGQTYAVQCKCYSASVGNKAVQEVFTGKAFYHRDIAVVITNSTFSRAAIETATATGVLLWDRNKLQELISHADQRSLITLLNQVE